MTWSKAEAAQAMGMAEREIVDVVQLGDGHVVTTHDRQRTLMRPGHKPVLYKGALPGDVPAVVDEGQALDEGQAAGDVPGTGGEGEGTGDPSTDVPDGTAEQVLEWVAGDPDRARQAFDAEQAKAKPRAGLTGALEKVIGE